MSIILKGIDLPNCSNEDCIVVIRKDKAEVWQTGFKERTVEAIQIPKGHGDIKDINTFLKDKCLTEYIENDVFNKKYSYTIGTDAIYNAPTILEAEE